MLIDIPMQGPKELNDVRVALNQVLTDIVAGLDLGSVVMDSMAKLSAAVTNYQAIPQEFVDNKAEFLALTGRMGGEVAGILFASKKTKTTLGAAV